MQSPLFACRHSPSLAHVTVGNCDSRGCGGPCQSRGHYTVTGKDRKIHHPNLHPQGRIQSQMTLSGRTDKNSPPVWERMEAHLCLPVIRHSDYDEELTRCRSDHAREEEGTG